jgi:6,7-dimethyl-8-ribityllumazine synthase
MKNSQRAEFPIFVATTYHVALVISRFNRDLTESLEQSALAMLASYRVPKKNIQIFQVAGAVEIPVLLNKLAQTQKYDALVALGAIIKGGTPHFDYVAKLATEGILRVALDHNLPIGFGILTTNNLRQARARLNAGGEAVAAALHSARLVRSIH